LLRNETTTGVTVIEMSPTFDTGAILRQAELAITATDTRETIYHKLYHLGGALLPQVITDFAHKKLRSTPQPTVSPTPYAKRFTRDDSFIDWTGIQAAMAGKPVATTQLGPLLAEVFVNQTIYGEDIARATRALANFPGLWTIVSTPKGETRMKILEAEAHNHQLVLKKVQLAGQQPALWNQVKNNLGE
jgi:methionyl-tRNA formyltransferase